MTEFASELARLTENGRFVQNTLEAGRITQETGRETEYRVMRNSTNENIFIAPRIGDTDGVTMDLRDIRRYRKNGGKMVYSAHFHPQGAFASPSNGDLNTAEIHSRNDTPIFAVCIGNGEECVCTAFRRKRPATYVERGFALARNATNRFLDTIGLDTKGFTGTAYRRYVSAVNGKGKKYLDIIPDALEATGVYEARSFEIKNGELYIHKNDDFG